MGVCFLETSQHNQWHHTGFTVRAWWSTLLSHNAILTLANGVLEPSDAINELSVLLQVCLWGGGADRWALLQVWKTEKRYEEILLLTHWVSEFESDQSLLVPGLTDALQPTCTCAPHTQKLWKWQVSSRFPRNRICLMGRSSCCDTVVKETGPKPCIHTDFEHIPVSASLD